jgi:hypothetical protein
VAELDALIAEPTTVRLSTGTVLQIERLRARQFFKLLRIVTRGALPAMQDMSLFKIGADMDAREFAGRFLSLMLLSIPEAEDEAIEFVQAMVTPVGLIERRGLKLNKADAERNTELWTKVITDTDNPELEDLVTIIEAIVQREAADIQALGKRLAAMFKLAEKTGQLKEAKGGKSSGRPSRTSPDGNSSEGSPEQSTFFVTSTDGLTSTASTYTSSGYANVSLPSENDGSTSGGNTSSG